LDYIKVCPGSGKLLKSQVVSLSEENEQVDYIHNTGNQVDNIFVGIEFGMVFILIIKCCSLQL
jgi:hypothetical protein